MTTRLTYRPLLVLWLLSVGLGGTHIMATPVDIQAAQTHCQKILNRIWSKQGGQKKPGIFVEKIAAYGKPAAFDHRRHAIVVDPQTYTLCLRISQPRDDALAFIIAHEFIHSHQHGAFDYEDPGFFVKSGTLKGWARTQRDKRRRMETQADIWGAVLCHLSGYQVKDVIPNFIEELYTSFKLASEDPLYDSKEERMAIARRAQTEVDRAIMLYDMANYFSLLQLHEKDTVIYQHLLSSFQSVEFYNNLGLSYMMLALPKLEEPYRSNPYPFVLDTDTRLAHVYKGRLGPYGLLRKSLEQFSSAERLNPGYLPMHINKAIALHLLSSMQTRSADAYQERALRELADVQKATASGYGGTATEVKRLKQDAALAHTMIKAPHIWPPEKRISFRESPTPEVLYGRWDGVNLSQTAQMQNLSYDWEQGISFESNIKIYGRRLPNSMLMVYHDPNGKDFYMQGVFKTLKDLPFRYQKRVFQVGSYIPEGVRSQMRMSLPSLQGEAFLTDDKLGIIYKLTPQFRVKEWIVFREG
ncbi:MAG: hypothetical protein AAFR61_21615 [Bacteroidota bacterium]